MYTCLHTHIHIYMYTLSHMHTYTHSHVHIYTHTQALSYTHVLLHTYIFSYVCSHYTHTCIHRHITHIPMYTFLHIYLHTYTLTHTTLGIQHIIVQRPKDLSDPVWKGYDFSLFTLSKDTLLILAMVGTPWCEACHEQCLQNVSHEKSSSL